MSLFNYKRFTGWSGEVDGPYVVDTHATRPPVPPRLHQKRRRGEVAQTLLFLLVSLALFCVVIEACIIYHLHQLNHSDNADSPVAYKFIAARQTGENVTAATQPPREILPSKPVAHLEGVNIAIQDSQIMDWNMVPEPLLHEMDYKDKSLIIQKDGFYYVYSKVYFTDIPRFNHSIEKRTNRYPKGSIPLLQSREYSQKSRSTQSNSFLGGVFQLEKNDAIHVKVSSTKKVLKYNSVENVFGAFMI